MVVDQADVEDEHVRRAHDAEQPEGTVVGDGAVILGTAGVRVVVRATGM